MPHETARHHVEEMPMPVGDFRREPSARGLPFSGTRQESHVKSDASQEPARHGLLLPRRCFVAAGPCRRVGWRRSAGDHQAGCRMKKAYTARTFARSSGDFADGVKGNPNAGALFLTNITPARGALPIKIGNDTIGAVGVSGAPGGDKDEACAKAGIDKVSADLK
jgi:hypothetical protein